MWYRFFEKLEGNLIHTFWPGHGEDQNENVQDEILIINE